MTIDPVAAALQAAEAAAAQSTQVVLPPAPPGFQTVTAPGTPLGYTFVPLPAAPVAAAAAPVYHAPTVTQPSAASVATQVGARQPGRKLTMSSIQEERGTMVTDYYISVDENGIKVKFSDEDPKAILSNKIIPQMFGFIDFSAIAFGYGVRYQDHTGSITYARTYDGVKTTDGTNWTTAIATAKSVDPKNRGEYPFVDVIVELTQPAISLDGAVVLPAGVKVGFSTSPTVWKAWQTFYSQALQAGLIVENDLGEPSGEVDLILGFVAKSKDKNNWGVWKFAIDENPANLSTGGAAPAAPNTVEQPAAQTMAQPAAAPIAETVVQPAADPAAAPAGRRRARPATA